MLVGNSRWHWYSRLAEGKAQGWSEAPTAGQQRLKALMPEQLVAWAAVGNDPDPLPQEPRITTVQVPLAQAPPWLGVDRALAGWAAWRRSGRQPVLVADAGTALSLTRVDGEGRFAGGRLLAGAGLQLRALAQGTAVLPELAPTTFCTDQPANDWPEATDQAMAIGISQALAAALVDAAHRLQRSELQLHQLWLTGGDGPWLAPLLAQAGQSWHQDPLLVVEALAELRPAPDL